MFDQARTPFLAPLAMALLAAGCPRAEPAAGLDAAPAAAAEIADAGSPDVAAPEPADAGPQPLTFKLSAKSGEAARELVRGGENEGIPVNARFKLELPPLKDFRVRLFADADKVVPSADRAELTAKALSYELVPSEPLITGSKYALVIDGMSTDYAIDADGNSYELVRLELKTEGEKPRPAGSKKPQKPKKKP